MDRGKMSEPSGLKPMFKVWLETDDGFVFGPGVYSLLRKVDETGTLKEAAESLDMSYRYAWGLVKKAEGTLGQPLLHTHKGGRAGGGGTELTEIGQQFIEDFSKIGKLFNMLSEDPEMLDRLSDVNYLEAEVSEIEEHGETATLSLKSSEPNKITIRVSSEYLTKMGLGEGDRVKVEYRALVGRITKSD